MTTMPEIRETIEYRFKDKVLSREEHELLNTIIDAIEKWSLTDVDKDNDIDKKDILAIKQYETQLVEDLFSHLFAGTPLLDDLTNLRTETAITQRITGEFDRQIMPTEDEQTLIDGLFIDAEPSYQFLQEQIRADIFLAKVEEWGSELWSQLVNRFNSHSQDHNISYSATNDGMLQFIQTTKEGENKEIVNVPIKFRVVGNEAGEKTIVPRVYTTTSLVETPWKTYDIFTRNSKTDGWQTLSESNAHFSLENTNINWLPIWNIEQITFSPDTISRTADTFKDQFVEYTSQLDGLDLTPSQYETALSNLKTHIVELRTATWSDFSMYEKEIENIIAIATQQSTDNIQTRQNRIKQDKTRLEIQASTAEHARSSEVIPDFTWKQKEAKSTCESYLNSPSFDPEAGFASYQQYIRKLNNTNETKAWEITDLTNFKNQLLEQVKIKIDKAKSPEELTKITKKREADAQEKREKKIIDRMNFYKESRDFQREVFLNKLSSEWETQFWFELPMPKWANSKKRIADVKKWFKAPGSTLTKDDGERASLLIKTMLAVDYLPETKVNSKRNDHMDTWEFVTPTNNKVRIKNTANKLETSFWE